MKGHKKVKTMLARRIRNCRECDSLSLLEEAKKMIGAGEEVFNLALEEFDCIEYQDQENRRFDEFEPLENKVSEKLRIENGLSYPSQNIVISNGIKSSFSLALQTILNPKDEVIIPLPHSPGYPEMIKLASGKPVLVKLQAQDDYKLTPKCLKKAITEKTRAIIFTNPVNPTGLIYTIDELLELAEIIIEKKLILISDESNEPFIYEGKNHISIASLNADIKNASILINDFSGCSKKNQWHLSYLAGNEMIISGIKKIQNYMVSGPSEFAKEKTLMDLEMRNQQIDKRMVFLKRQRDQIFYYLDQIKAIDYIKSQASVYVLVDISEVLKKKQHAINSENSLGFCQALLKRANTLVMPGEIFGMPGMIRLCFAVNALEKGIENLTSFIEKY